MVVQVDINGKVSAQRPGLLSRLFSNDGVNHSFLAAEMETCSRVRNILFDDTAKLDSKLDYMLTDVVVRHLDPRTKVVPQATKNLVANYVSQGVEQTNKAFEIALYLLLNKQEGAALEVYQGIIQGDTGILDKAVAGANLEGIRVSTEKNYDSLTAVACWQNVIRNDPTFFDRRYDRVLVETALFAEPAQKRTNPLVKLGKALGKTGLGETLDSLGRGVIRNWPKDEVVTIAPVIQVARGNFVLSEAYLNKWMMNEKESHDCLTEVVEHYTAALAKDMGQTGDIVQAGKCYLRISRQAMSLPAFYAVLKRHEGTPSYEGVLRDVKSADGEAGEIASSLAQGNGEQAVSVAKQFRERKEYEECLDICKSISAIDPTNYHSTYVAAAAAFEMGEQDSVALAYITRTLDLNPSSPAAKKLAGKIESRIAAAPVWRV